MNAISHAWNISWNQATRNLANGNLVWPYAIGSSRMAEFSEGGRPLRWPRRRLTVRRLMILVAIGAVLFAAARSTRRFRLCMDLADNYAWLRSQEPWAKGMVVETKEQERSVIEPSRIRAAYYARQEAKYRWAAWKFWETVPSADPPQMNVRPIPRG